MFTVSHRPPQQTVYDKGLAVTDSCCAVTSDSINYPVTHLSKKTKI